MVPLNARCISIYQGAYFFKKALRVSLIATSVVHHFAYLQQCNCSCKTSTSPLPPEAVYVTCKHPGTPRDRFLGRTLLEGSCKRERNAFVFCTKHKAWHHRCHRGPSPTHRTSWTIYRAPYTTEILLCQWHFNLGMSPADPSPPSQAANHPLAAQGDSPSHLLGVVGCLSMTKHEAPMSI